MKLHQRPSACARIKVIDVWKDGERAGEGKGWEKHMLSNNEWCADCAVFVDE